MNFSNSVLIVLTVAATLPCNNTYCSEPTSTNALAAQVYRFKLVVDADTTRLSSLLDDELVYTHTTGTTESKSQFLETVRSQRINYKAIEPVEVAVRLEANVAIITGTVNIEGEVGNRVSEFSARFVEVSRFVEGQWKLVTWQTVRVAK